MQNSHQKFKNSLRFLLAIPLVLATSVSEARTFIALTPGTSITQGLFRTAGGSQSGVTSPQSGSFNFGGYQPFAANMRFGINNADRVNLYNWGVAGALSSQGVNWIGTTLNSRFAHFVFLEYGANDIYNGIGGTTTAANLGIMADKAIAKKVVPFFGTISPNTNMSGFNGALRDTYNPRIVSKANSKVVPVPDSIISAPLVNETTSAPVADHWSFMCRISSDPTCSHWNGLHSGDGLHLNSAGNQEMASVWIAALNKYLDALQLQRLTITAPLEILLLGD